MWAPPAAGATITSTAEAKDRRRLHWQRGTGGTRGRRLGGLEWMTWGARGCRLGTLVLTEMQGSEGGLIDGHALLDLYK